MLVVEKISEVQYTIRKWRLEGFTVGFVPTMGSLHNGHLELVKRSKKECDKTVVSIFVNKTQFNDPSDYDKYPRNLTKDTDFLKEDADLVFAPLHEEMYSGTPLLSMNFGSLETVMEGRFRPGHFNGVGLVVSKLFNIVQPDVAVFGQKDLQQFAIIHQLVNDLCFPIQLICHPIVRNEKGLALSSRNSRLSSEALDLSIHLYATLKKVEQLLLDGETIENGASKGLSYFNSVEGFTIDYLEIVDATTLQPLTKTTSGTTLAICIAAFIEEVRLIDNLLVDL